MHGTAGAGATDAGDGLEDSDAGVAVPSRTDALYL